MKKKKITAEEKLQKGQMINKNRSRCDTSIARKTQSEGTD